MAGIYRVADVPGIGRMFPDLPEAAICSKDEIKITHEGVYSITDPKIMGLLIREITGRALQWAGMGVNVNIRDLTVTDATSNCGGSVLGFANIFGNVNAVEIDEKTYQVLSHNITAYGFKNVKLINDDYTKIMCDLKQDIIFIDPPWGGRGYDSKVGLKLKLGDLTMREIVLKGLSVAKLVILKLPFNYDFSEFNGIEHYQKNLTRMVFVFFKATSDKTTTMLT
jgi:hypothetical protein